MVRNRLTGVRVNEDSQVPAIERKPGDKFVEQPGIKFDLVAPPWMRSHRLVMPTSINSLELILKAKPYMRRRLFRRSVIVDVRMVALDVLAQFFRHSDKTRQWRA